MEEIFEMLVNNAVNGRLDRFAAVDEEYRKLDSGLDGAAVRHVEM